MYITITLSNEKAHCYHYSTFIIIIIKINKPEMNLDEEEDQS